MSLREDNTLVNVEEEIQKLLEIESTSLKQFQNGDIDSMMNVFSDDVQFFNPGADILVGKQSERELLEQALATEGLEFSFEPTDARVSSSGDMGFVWGQIQTKMPDGSMVFEKYVTIYSRIEGQWKMVLQMRNSN